MTEAPLSPEEEDIALAGEYVLGVLDQAERAAVERRLRKDTAFSAAVAAWEARLAGLNDGFAEERPPALLPAIEARLFGAADADLRRRRGRVAGWWAGFASGTVMAAILATLALSVLPPPRTFVPGRLEARLEAEGQALVFAAAYDAAARELVVTRTAGAAAAAGQVHELWLIAGDAAPVPLGLIGTGPLRADLPSLPEGAVLAVSLEPEGGSPTGAPTGPVLVTGVVTGL